MQHRILVVSQDVMLRSTLARWLTPAGYIVELAEGDRRAREVDQARAVSSPWNCPGAACPDLGDGVNRAGAEVV